MRICINKGNIRTFHLVTTKPRAWNEKLDHISKARFPANSLNFSDRGCFLRYKESSGSSRRSRRAYATSIRTYCEKSSRTFAVNWRESAAAHRYWDSICVSVRTNAVSQLQSEEKQRASAKGECGTDDVKWIGQTDRRDRHNSPSKQYLGGARHPGDTCRFPPGNIGLSSRARSRIRVSQHSKNSLRDRGSAFMHRDIEFARRFSQGGNVFVRVWGDLRFYTESKAITFTQAKRKRISFHIF